MNALTNLGVIEALLCVFSFLKAQLIPERPENNFEIWISNRFGKRLFRTSSKLHRKGLGHPCHEIGRVGRAANSRLSLASLIRSALLPRKKDKGKVIKTLIDEFDYPRRVPHDVTAPGRIVESRNSKSLHRSRWNACAGSPAVS